MVRVPGPIDIHTNTVTKKTQRKSQGIPTVKVDRKYQTS